MQKWFVTTLHIIFLQFKQLFPQFQYLFRTPFIYSSNSYISCTCNIYFFTCSIFPRTFRICFCTFVSATFILSLQHLFLHFQLLFLHLQHSFNHFKQRCCHASDSNDIRTNNVIKCNPHESVLNQTLWENLHFVTLSSLCTHPQWETICSVEKISNYDTGLPVCIGGGPGSVVEVHSCHHCLYWLWHSLIISPVYGWSTLTYQVWPSHSGQIVWAAWIGQVGGGVLNSKHIIRDIQESAGTAVADNWIDEDGLKLPAWKVGNRGFDSRGVSSSVNTNY